MKGYYLAVPSSVKSPEAKNSVKFTFEYKLDNFDYETEYDIPTKDKDIR